MTQGEPRSEYEPVNMSRLTPSQILQMATLNSDVGVLSDLQHELSKRLIKDPYDQEVRSNHIYVTQRLQDRSLTPKDRAFDDIVKDFNIDD